MFETIIALATPPLKAALAIIRMSGEDSLDIMDRCFSKSIKNVQERTILYGHIMDQDKTVDEVILNVYPNSHSYTGEPLIEIQCHGSMVIVRQIMALLIKHGAREAERGEFTARAFFHGRIDLVQAEAVNDIINASTIEAKDLALLSLKGKTSEKLMPLKTELADLLALIEVNIDYPEYEDIEIVTAQKIKDEAQKMGAAIKALIREGKEGQRIKDGIKVAIVGKPNVGKSSLLNALIKEQKAIVTDIAGTTRDVVEGEIVLQGLTLHLLDTAGIHASNDQVENIGIDKAHQVLNNADLIILVIDASQEETNEDLRLRQETAEKKRIIVYNKQDLMISKSVKKDGIFLSAKNGHLVELEREIVRQIGIDERVYLNPSFANERQLGLLEKAGLALQKAQEEVDSGLTLDLVAISIQEAYSSILSIIGEAKGNDFTEEIFSRFCVGK